MSIFVSGNQLVTAVYQGEIKVPLFLPIYSLPQWSGIGSVAAGVNGFFNSRCVFPLLSRVQTNTDTNAVGRLVATMLSTTIQTNLYYNLNNTPGYNLGSTPRSRPLFYANQLVSYFNTSSFADGASQTFYGANYSMGMPFGQDTTVSNVNLTNYSTTIPTGNSLTPNETYLMTTGLGAVVGNIFDVISPNLMVRLFGNFWAGDFNGQFISSNDVEYVFVTSDGTNIDCTQIVNNIPDFTNNFNYFLQYAYAGSSFPNNIKIIKVAGQLPMPSFPASNNIPGIRYVITFDNAAIQASVISGSSVNSQATQQGYCFKLSTTALGGHKDCIILSLDGSKWWSIRFLPQNSTAQTLFNTINGNPGGIPFTIDPTGYVYVGNNANLSQFLTSFSANLTLGLPQFFDISKLPAIPLPCIPNCF